MKKNPLLILVTILLSSCTMPVIPTSTQTRQPPTSILVIPTNTKIATQALSQTTSSEAIITVPPGGSIQDAVNLASAGDVIAVLNGNYDERITVDKSLSFEAVDKVTTLGFVIRADGVTVRGFTIINLTDTGIIVESGSAGVIEDNTFLFNGLGGLKLHNGTESWIIRRNLFHRNNLYGIEIRGQNHLIEGNEVTHTIQHHPCVPAVNGADADGFRFHGSGHIFRNNYIHDMPDGHRGYDQTSCSMEELENLDNDYDNNSHTDCFQTYEGGTSFVAGYNILFEGNICDLPPANEWTAGFASKAFQGEGNTYNLTFRNNLVLADFLSLFSDGCHDIIFDHNTFIGSNSTDSAGLKYIDCVGNAGSVKNNIFIGQRTSAGHLMVQKSSVDAGYNCVYVPDHEPFRLPDPGDVWGVDPRLDTDYRLLPDSPCIGAAEDGSDLGAFPYVALP